jgi:hypothetical protein
VDERWQRWWRGRGSVWPSDVANDEWCGDFCSSVSVRHGRVRHATQCGAGFRTTPATSTMCYPSPEESPLALRRGCMSAGATVAIVGIVAAGVVLAVLAVRRKMKSLTIDPQSGLIHLEVDPGADRHEITATRSTFTDSKVDVSEGTTTAFDKTTSKNSTFVTRGRSSSGGTEKIEKPPTG